jgi:hypothetical protein
MDYMKAYRESKFPEIRRPSRKLIVNPDLETVTKWIRNVLNNPPEYLTVDCETSGGIIDTIGFSIDLSESLVIPFGPHRFKIGYRFDLIYPERNSVKVNSYWSFEEEVQIWLLIKELLESNIPKVFQNGLYDLQYIVKMKIKPRNCKDDTMLCWHALYPESPKNLGYLGSILTDESSWKELRRHKSDTSKQDE